jgi:regulator of sigma D
MSDSLVKSPMQLKYELENTQNELDTLLKNRKKKREDTLGRLINYRAELKEQEAVMAATEQGYKAYLSLTQFILNLPALPHINANVSVASFQENDADMIFQVADYVQKVVDFTEAAQEKEAERINQAREAFKTQSEHIVRKTKEIYAAMGEEKQQIEAYAETLTQKIKETEEQLQAQMKMSGMGIGL